MSRDPRIHRLVTGTAKLVSIARAIDCVNPYADEARISPILIALRAVHAEVQQDTEDSISDIKQELDHDPTA